MSATLKEIARYCRGENTFGALLLCGEWGSGKTHLLEKDLPAELGAGYILLRISLFGEESLDEIRKKIRREYLEHFLMILREESANPVSGSAETATAPSANVSDDSSGTATAPSANDWVYRIGEEGPWMSMYLQDPYEYIQPEPVMAGRRVILIFDDLERTNLSQVEILGCINEYCENLHIKTIIVANEEKIENRNSSEAGSSADRKREFLNYSEMKEKLIEQTVRLHVDETAVIDSILKQYRTSLKGYKDFLQNTRQELYALLASCEVHNIRSLRSGLQDFERIFEFCREEQMPEADIRPVFTSFVLFTILSKNGRISRSKLYGYGLNKLQQKYPEFYQDRCLPLCLKDSITSGNWDDDILRPQIHHMKEAFQGMSRPENRLRSLSFAEIDDSVLAEGWSTYLHMAEEGVLAPDEYIVLIRNLISSREYEGFCWPETPDMRKIKKGLEISLAQANDAQSAPEFRAEPLTEKELSACTEAEQTIYQKILTYIEGGEYRRRADRNQLLAACRSHDEKAIRTCRHSVLSGLDEELIQAVIDHFDSLENNQRRITFADLIAKIVSDSKRELPDSTEDLLEGLPQLTAILREKATEADQDGQPMKAVTLRHFLHLL